MAQTLGGKSKRFLIIDCYHNFAKIFAIFMQKHFIAFAVSELITWFLDISEIAVTEHLFYTMFSHPNFLIDFAFRGVSC